MLHGLSETFEGIRIAFVALRTNTLRSFLTTLGVVIGITFVILVGWLLQGLDNVLNDTINLFGTDVLYIDKFDWSGKHDWKTMMNRKNITLQQAREFETAFPNAQTVVPMSRQEGMQIKYGNQKRSGVILLGTMSAYSTILGNLVESGRFLSPFEDMYSPNVAVIGNALAAGLFPFQDPVGESIKIKGRYFKVIGVLKKRATLLFPNIDKEVYIPLVSYLDMYGSDNSVTIAVKTGNEEKLEATRIEAIGTMRRIRNNQPGRDEDFSINSAQQFRDNVAAFRMTVWAVGIGLTTLSFIVGVIGIMNIMFVSVTERTKEIGIRKALGARKRSILFQFLVEAAALCFAGAVVAFLLCSAIMFSVVTFIEQASFLTAFIPPQLLLTASVVAVAVGIIAGIIPAFRAAKLHPVIALRYE